MPTIATNGNQNISVVNGSSRVGAHALDGSLNVIQSAGNTFTGLRHSSGATYVVPTAVPVIGLQHPSGALYVSVSPHQPGSSKVTVVTGALT